MARQRGEQIEAARELASFWRYAAALVEARTESPGYDFVSALMQAGPADGDALSREEAVSIMLQMLFAGHDTTTKLMGNSFRRLLEDRASWEAICRDPGLIPNAIEEVLRFDGSVIAWRHKTKEPVEIGEARLPKDTKRLLLLASANRDPAVFPDPDRFDIRRPNAHEHLSFGVGVHNLLGRAVGAAGGAHRAGGGQPPPAVPATDREREAQFSRQYLDAGTGFAAGRLVRVDDRLEAR
jgi:cytochrome P450